MIERKEYQKALNKLKNIESETVEYLNLAFYINFLLAKEEKYSYNKEKAIEIANKIKEKEMPFDYTEELKALET